ncbi:MAG: hypothetical protein ICV73_18185 [Acetobacteraceae bacterium]|nr:hypothetical protein [Acetobacteraceae bacterium]
MSHPALRHGAALLLCVLPLLGCAGAAGGSGGGKGLSGTSPADRTRFEGRYEGRRFPQESGGPNSCRGQARTVRFEVENGIIEMRSVRPARNKRKADLWGAVAADGQVTMRPTSGKRMVIGRIEGDRLTATDTLEPQALAQTALEGGRTPCQYRYEATRVGSASALSGRGGRAADTAGVGAPPSERFPQP